MPSTECPECHMPTSSGMGKMYCPQCGWNRGAAEKQTPLLLRVLPVLVMLFDAPLIVWIFIGHAEVSVLALLGFLAICARSCGCLDCAGENSYRNVTTDFSLCRFRFDTNFPPHNQ